MTIGTSLRKLAWRALEKVIPGIAWLSRASADTHKCFFDAVRAAQSAGAPSILPEHLALGLLSSENVPVRTILELHGSPVAPVPPVPDATLLPSTPTSEDEAVDLPMSRAAAGVLEKATRYSISSGHQRVHCVHLLLAMLEADADAARSMLAARETLTAEAVEPSLREISDEGQEGKGGLMFFEMGKRKRRKPPPSRHA